MMVMTLLGEYCTLLASLTMYGLMGTGLLKQSINNLVEFDQQSQLYNGTFSINRVYKASALYQQGLQSTSQHNLPSKRGGSNSSIQQSLRLARSAAV